MSGIVRCTALLAAWCASLASAQDLEVPPPPTEADTAIVVEPDPELAEAAARHLDRHATEAAPSFHDALREDDREGALQAIQLGRTPALACLEAMLLEEQVRTFYVPQLDRDPLTLRVVETQAATLLTTIQPLRFAYARCLATIDRAPQFTEHEQTFHQRADELEMARALVMGDDAAAAHPAMLALVENAPELAWSEQRTLFEASHGPIRSDPDEEKLEGWQSGAVITTSMLFAGALMSMVIGVRVESSTGRARFMLGALGLTVGTFPGMLLGRTWSNPESEWTPHLLMAGALLTAGALGGGIALFRANVPRRIQMFGAMMASGGASNLVWLAGGSASIDVSAAGCAGGRPSRSPTDMGASGGPAPSNRSDRV